MNVVETIEAVRVHGGSVSVHAGALIVDAPPDLPTAVWDALATHKTTLLNLLAPAVSHVDLSAQEEREAIQLEAQAPADSVTFDQPRAARRFRLLRDTPWQSPTLGGVTFPAGLTGYVIDDLAMVESPIDRLALAWVLEADRREGKSTVPVLIDGKPRVLDTSAVSVLEVGDPAHE